MPMGKIRILLADDHEVVREGLKSLINAEPDMVVIGEAEDGPTAINLAAHLKPDLVVLDISMPGVSGASVGRRIKSGNPKLKIVTLTVHEDKSYLEQFLAAGVSAYVLKRAASRDLINAVRTVAKGGSYLDPGIVGTVVQTFAWKESSSRGAQGLSDRETTVAKLISQGYTSKEVAAQLDISIKTVETHKARCMDKLGLHSRAELVRHALDRGWLQGR